VALRLCLVGAVAALATAGCTSPAPSPTTPASTGASTPTTASTTPATSTSAPVVAKAGCPVDAATLEKAFKANAQLADAIVLGNGLRDVTCYQDFAVARATPTNVDAATVLFSYDKTKSVWTAVTGGTSIQCGNVVPDAVIPHLPGCAD
jgi:hypothetical protein